MEVAALMAVLAAFASFPGLILGLLLVGVGYVLRKYVEKRWPDEAAMADAIAKKYGKEAEARLKELKAKTGL